MSRESFHILLQRYLNGTCSEEEKLLVQEWYQLVGAADDLPLADAFGAQPTSFSEDDLEKLEQKIWDKIALETKVAHVAFSTTEGKIEEPFVHSIEPTQSISLTIRWKWIAAALVAGIIATTSWWFLQTSGGKPKLASFPVQASVAFIENKGSSEQRVQLPDGSIAILQPKSMIEFTKNWLNLDAGKAREVWMKGSVFFEVEKNVHHPFLVYHGQLITKVLGTSFFIRFEEEDKPAEVKVKTGVVAVYQRESDAGGLTNSNDQFDRPSTPTEKELNNTSQPVSDSSFDQKNNSSSNKSLSNISAYNGSENNGVILRPNQQVVFYPDKKHFVTSLVAKPEPIYPGRFDPQQELVFNDTPLKNVLEVLSRVYQVNILVANPDLYNCPFTGDISQQDLYTQLQLICKSIQARYQIKGTEILIEGIGCERN
jgi:transmembrane sensor